MADMFNMLRQAHALKEKMAQFQEELELQAFTATSGGVTVVMNGKQEIKKLTIDPKVFQMGDAERLEEAVTAAINKAGNEVKERLKSEVSKLTGGLGLPGLF